MASKVSGGPSPKGGLRRGAPAINRRRFTLMAGGTLAGGLLASGLRMRQLRAATDGSGETLRITTTGDVEVLDPNFLLSDVELRVCEMLFNGLVGVDPDLNVVPDLAEEWAISADAKSYEFKLRQGVLFHHGRELNAGDVGFTLERFKDSWVSYVVDDLDRIEIVDPHFLRLQFKQPAAHFLGSMAPRWTAIVPKDLVEEHGNDHFKLNPVGTGAFRFVEHVPLQHILLERHADYFEQGLPKVDRLEWVPVQDESARSMQVIGGSAELDLWAPLKLIESFESSPGVQVLGGPTSRYEFAELNNARPPFDDVRMRRAVAFATDRQAIVDLALSGHGEALVGGPIGPAGNPFFNGFTTYAEPDLERARALIEEAGHGSGITVEGLAEGGSRYSDVLEILQQRWAQVGITININAMEVGAARARRREGDYDVMIQGWGTLVDPNDFVGEQFMTTGGLNFGKSGNAELDELLLQGKRETDFEKREAIYREVERYILEESVPMVLLYRPFEFAAFGEQVVGLEHEAGRTRISLTRTSISS